MAVIPESEDVTSVSDDVVVDTDDSSETVVEEEEVSSASTTSTPVISDDDEVELTKISVTGSRIKRTDLEGPQPLVVITSDDIDKGGIGDDGGVHIALIPTMFLVMVTGDIIVIVDSEDGSGRGKWGRQRELCF